MIVFKKFYKSNITKRYISWLNDPKIIKYTTIKKKTNLTQVKKYIDNCNKNKKVQLYRIFYKKIHVGNIRSQLLNKNTSTIGIIIGYKKFQGRGIGTEALKKIIINLRKNGTNKFIAYIHSKNLSSIKIFKKNNFKKTKKKSVYKLIL
ncbi:GNAT family N-acetyltransferase [Pelagibacterales bacterium SAG-MED15]|nr:GNAT family N-acetyltransferase [Pelagibacterales bacterium SAG-MED15]